VILPVERLVAGLEEALEVVATLAATHSNPFLVTGPSRTSDIEMEMVLGAHGPKALHVLLVSEVADAEGVVQLLDAIPGSFERAKLRVQQARSGETTTLDDL
jgi:hypothetical protein